MPLSLKDNTVYIFFPKADDMFWSYIMIFKSKFKHEGNDDLDLKRIAMSCEQSSKISYTSIIPKCRFLFHFRTTKNMSHESPDFQFTLVHHKSQWWCLVKGSMAWVTMGTTYQSDGYAEAWHEAESRRAGFDSVPILTLITGSRSRFHSLFRDHKKAKGWLQEGPLCSPLITGYL